MEESKKNKKCNCSTLEKQLEVVSLEKNKWEECARHYAEKFQIAYKGFLMTQGISEPKAQQESIQVLDKLHSCEC